MPQKEDLTICIKGKLIDFSSPKVMGIVNFTTDSFYEKSRWNIDGLKYADIINRGLKVIDFTAATMCMENNVPTLAFGLNEENSIVRAVCGEGLGTVICCE